MMFGLTDNQSILTGNGLTRVSMGRIARGWGLEPGRVIFKASRPQTRGLYVDLPGFFHDFTIPSTISSNAGK
jgi:hypothetical protein